MSGGIGLALRQVHYENRAFWRNPAAAFFTFVFPLMFMVIFNVLFGGLGRGSSSASQFYTPTLIVFSVITATFTNIAMSVTMARDEGVLKRVRGTPLPAWAFLAGRVLHAILIAALLVMIISAFGAILYQVRFPWERLPAVVATLAVGAATFSSLGLALTGVIPNGDAAPAVVNATILPLEFISNIFIDMRQAPGWLNSVSEIFPVRHFADAMLALWNPTTAGSGSAPGDLLVIVGWGVAGLLLALRFFSWEPRIS
ncbi:MAG: ABC transporter permease [Candidatus Limnocylindria bacterium]